MEDDGPGDGDGDTGDGDGDTGDGDGDTGDGDGDAGGGDGTITWTRVDPSGHHEGRAEQRLQLRGHHGVAVAEPDVVGRAHHLVLGILRRGSAQQHDAAHGDVLSKQYDDNSVKIHCRMPQKYLGRITDPEVKIQPRKSAALDASPEEDISAPSRVEDVA